MMEDMNKIMQNKENLSRWIYKTRIKMTRPSKYNISIICI